MSTSNYIRLQELVIDKFNLDAPVEIEKGALLLESTSKTVLLQLRLNALDNVNEISSTSVNIYGFTDSGEPVEGFSPFTYTFSDIYLQGMKAFGDRTPIIVDPRIRKVKVEIDKVVFRRGSVWRNPEEYFTPPTQKHMSSIKAGLLPQFGRETWRLSETEKHNFKYIPQQFDEYWLCTCGRPNRKEYEICSRCGLHREVIFQLTDEGYLQSNLQKFNEQARIAEENRLRAEAESKALAAKRKRQLTVVLMALFAIGSLLSLFIYVIQPAIKYNQAKALLSIKDFDGAISAFTLLEDYKDSSEMVKESTYQKAVDFLANKKFDNSISIFSSLGEYKDSADLIKESKYQEAIDYLTNEKFDGAISAFTLLEDYKDSSEMVKESTYQKAVDYLANDNYDEAFTLFSSLGDYRDSGLMAMESKFQKANELFSGREFDAARKIFVELDNYASSADLVKEIDYLNASELLSKNQFEQALIILEKITGYKDSDILLQEANYRIAVSLFNDKQYFKSHNLFAELGDYKDSNSYVEAVNMEIRNQKERIPEMQLIEVINSIRWYNSFAWTSDEELAVVHWTGEPPFLLDYKNSQTVIQSEFINGGIQLDWSPDGNKFAILGLGGLEIWDVERGANIFQITENENIGEFQWAPVGEKLGIVDGKAIYIWDIEKGKNIKKIPLSTDIDNLYWSPDGNLVAGEDYDFLHDYVIVELWNATSGLSVQSFTGSFLQFSPDGRLIAIRNEDTQLVELWDLANGEQYHVITNVTNFYAGDFFSPTGDYYAVFQSGRLKVWDFSTNRLVNEFEESDEPHYDTSFTWSPDGKTIAINIMGRYLENPSYRDVLEIRSITSGDLLGKTDLLMWATASSYFSSDNYSPNGLVFADSSDGPVFGDSSNPEITKLYDAETGKLLLTLDGVFYPGCWSPNGSKLLVTHLNKNNWRYTFEIWELP